MSFEHSQTPNVVVTFIYPLRQMLFAAPIQVSLTYQQVKDASKQSGTLRSAAQAVIIPFTHQISLHNEVVKSNENSKI